MLSSSIWTAPCWTTKTHFTTVLPQSLAALSAARAAGVEVVVTGRHYTAIRPFYQALQITIPAICCNGAYLYDFQQKKVLAADPLPQAQARLVLQMLKQSDINALMYLDDAMLYQVPAAMLSVRWPGQRHCQRYNGQRYSRLTAWLRPLTKHNPFKNLPSRTRISRRCATLPRR